MTNKEQTKDIEKKVTKFTFNRTRLASYLSFVAIALLIIVFSLIPIGLSLDKLFSPTWWTNVVILIFLAVYGLPYGDSEGTNYYKTKINGAFIIARNQFLSFVMKLNEKKILTHFPEWLEFHYAKKREMTYRQMLFSLNIQDERILKVSFEDLKKLKKEITMCNVDGEEIIFDKLTEEQYDMLVSIKHGDIQIVTIDDYNYYLTESDDTSSDVDKQALDASRQKRKNKVIQYGTRIVTMVLVSVIWAGIFIDTASMGQGDQTLAQLAQPWFNLMSRLSCLATAITCGVQTAKINNKIDLFVFDYKKSVLQLFEQELENNIFVPADKEETLKQKYEKQEKIKDEYLKKQQEQKEKTLNDLNKNVNKDIQVPLVEMPNLTFMNDKNIFDFRR